MCHDEGGSSLTRAGAAQREFFAGHDAEGTAQWATGNVAQARPLFTWNNHTGVVTMTFFPALKKFIMCVSTPTFSPYTIKEFDTYFLEADAITGPFKMISYMSEFGPESYFVHYPSKFLADAPSKDGDGKPVFNGFLSYSANFAFRRWSDPPGSGYHWSLQEMRFRLA